MLKFMADNATFADHQDYVGSQISANFERP